MQRKRINGEVLTLEEAYLKHKRLIWDIAIKFAGRGKALGFEVEDLVSAGKVGFIKAYEKYNPEANKRFSTFAQPTISGYILMEVNRKDVNERMSLDVKEKAKKIAALEIEDVNVHKIMDALQIRYRYAYEVFHYLMYKESISLEKPLVVDSGGSEIYLSDALPRKEDFTRLIAADYKKLFNEKELTVCELLLQGYDQTEIKKKLGITRSAVGMRVARMREKIRECLANG